MSTAQSGQEAVDRTHQDGAREPSPPPARQPFRIGPYTVIGQIGRGAMGIVYAAYDEKLDRKIALKLLHSLQDTGTQGPARLLREAQTLARVSHPNVVQVYEIGTHDDEVFIAMEFVRGHTLRAWLQDRPHAWREVLAVFLQAGRGLVAAHAAGVVHRDFKPKSRRPSQTAPQPTDRPHSHELGRFERVDVDRLAPRYPALPQVLAKGWQGSQAALMPRRH